jgi:Na+/H+ antiporter NhaD/arsenite permease-like protein
VLDNAPTYLNVMTLILSKAGLSINEIADVKAFVAGENFSQLIALSSGAVFFGAMTYIGNGPNFMVKAIAEQNGVKMPDFGKYILKYSLPILLPVLFLVWILFFI